MNAREVFHVDADYEFVKYVLKLFKGKIIKIVKE